MSEKSINMEQLEGKLEIVSKEHAYREKEKYIHQKMTVRYDVQKQSWQVFDEVCTFLVSDFKINLKKDGVRLILSEIDGQKSPLADSGIFKGHQANVLERSYSVQGSTVITHVRWELMGPTGPVGISVLAEDPSENIEASLLEAICEGVVSFEGTTASCRLSPGECDANLMQIASGDAENFLNNAVYCKDKDAGVEILSPGLKLCKMNDMAGDAANTRQEYKLSANTAVQKGKWCKILSLELKEKVFGTLCPSFTPKPGPSKHKTPSGWLSYYCLFEWPTEESVLSILEFAGKHLVPFGMEYFSVEFWQSNHISSTVNGKRVPEDRHYWGVDNMKFPRGMKWLADEIRSRGMKPGIWAIPFGIHDEAYYYIHKEMFLHDAEGKPFFNWSGAYILDPTRSDAKQVMYRYIKLMTEEWGYDFLKLDGLSGGVDYSENFYNWPNVVESFSQPTVAPYRDCLQVMKSAMKEDTYFLACGGTSHGPCVGLADGARIAGDPIGSDGDPSWKTILFTAKAASKQYFFHHYLWHNDPDILMLREPLSLEEVKVAASFFGLTGQVLFNSDIMQEVSFERISILQKILPVLEAAPVQLFRVELKKVFDLKIKRDFEQWDVVGFFNWSEEENANAEVLSIKFDELGCDSKQAYLVYDFWNDYFVGSYTDAVEVTVEPHSCKVYSIRPFRNEPQVVSVNRHISQGGTCIKELHWDMDAGCLSGSSEVVGNHAYTVSIFVPDQWKVIEAASDSKVSVQIVENAENIVKLIITSPVNQTVDWRINFTG